MPEHYEGTIFMHPTMALASVGAVMASQKHWRYESATVCCYDGTIMRCGNGGGVRAGGAACCKLSHHMPETVTTRDIYLIFYQRENYSK